MHFIKFQNSVMAPSRPKEHSKETIPWELSLWGQPGRNGDPRKNTALFFKVSESLKDSEKPGDPNRVPGDLTFPANHCCCFIKMFLRFFKFLWNKIKHIGRWSSSNF